jgi:hypothetical protein
MRSQTACSKRARARNANVTEMSTNAKKNAQGRKYPLFPLRLLHHQIAQFVQMCPSPDAQLALWDFSGTAQPVLPEMSVPCVVDDLKYAIGSRFLLKDCSDCICRKGGVPQCQAFACQHCENPEYQNDHTSDCNCICKPCPQGFRICTTSRICIREEKWCDGIEDCDEDEKDCIEPPPPGIKLNSENGYLC